MYFDIVLAVTVGITFVAVLSRWLILRNRQRRREAAFAQHSITPEQLSEALAKRGRLPLFDLREPLDVVANSEIIPGATRISPYKVLENPWLIPKEKEAIIYCTSAEDEANIVIFERLLAMGFSKVRFLKGGLDAWKARGFKVDGYSETFRLNVAS